MKKYDFKYKPIQKTGEKEIISVIGAKKIDLYYFYPKTNEKEFIKTVKVKNPFKKD